MGRSPLKSKYFQQQAMTDRSIADTSLPSLKAHHHLSVRSPVPPFHHGPARRNIVLDCLADAIILGLYLHNHISRLRSWVLTEARQVKRCTRGDKTTRAHLELGPGLSSTLCYYRKHCWPFVHLPNTFTSPSPLSFLLFSLTFSSFPLMHAL